MPTEEAWYADRFVELLGFEPGELPGSVESWKQRVHPEDLPSTWDCIERHLKSGKTFDVEYRLQTKDGTYRWFRCRGTAYRNAAGEPEYLSGSLQDIDDLKRTQAMLREKESQLLQQQKMEAVGSLAGGVAHEFNNLLQAIRGFTLFAQEELDSDSQPYRDLEQSLAATSRAAKLSRQLLDFSRCEISEPKDCIADQFIERLAIMLTPLLPENIYIRFDLNVPNTTVRVDPTHMEQVLLNLCLNARDAMSEGGELWIGSDKVDLTESEAEAVADIPRGNYVRISITDTGSGIPLEIQDRIFDPFFTTKEVGCGTGLGLATSFGIVHRCGGHIHFDSEPGVGTTFQIYLPDTQRNAVDECVDHDLEAQQTYPTRQGSEMESVL